MNTQEKSIALANLMKWDVCKITEGADWHYMKVVDEGTVILEPYKDSQKGLAQFAAIMLKFPTAMEGFYLYDEVDECAKSILRWNPPKELRPTQENILNAVLRMKGVKI